MTALDRLNANRAIANGWPVDAWDVRSYHFPLGDPNCPICHGEGFYERRNFGRFAAEDVTEVRCDCRGAA